MEQDRCRAAGDSRLSSIEAALRPSRNVQVAPRLLPQGTRPAVTKAISVNKDTAWLVFSHAFCVAAAGTEFDYAPAAAP